MILIVANGDPPSPHLLSNLAGQCRGLIAVDGGLKACDNAQLTPDFILGDFDSIPQSLKKKYTHIPQIPTADQNKNDLEKAIEYLFSFPIEALTICGVFGRRIDHTLYNLNILTRYHEKITFVSENERCWMLSSPFTLKCQVGQKLSLIPISSPVTNVTTKGLKWDLHHQTLNHSQMSLSNICLKKYVTITFSEGHLLICLAT